MSRLSIPDLLGRTNRSGRTRWGASLRSSSRSRADCRTRPISPCSRYRRPPWTSLEERLDVPDAKSRASTRATAKPRVAASSATAAPVIPPPTTGRSNVSEPSRSKAAARVPSPLVGDPPAGGPFNAQLNAGSKQDAEQAPRHGEGPDGHEDDREQDGRPDQ